MAQFLVDLGQVLVNLLSSFTDALPGVAAAIIVVLLGYVVAALLGVAVRRILEALNFDNRLDAIITKEVIGKTKLAQLFGTLTKWYIFVIFLKAGVNTVNLGLLTEFVVLVVNWVPKLLVSVLLVLVAVLIGDYVYHIIRQTRMKGGELMGHALKWTIVVLFGMVALSQIGVSMTFLQWIVMLIVGALAAGFSLALGIGLGLGLKDEGKKFVKEMKK